MTPEQRDNLFIVVVIVVMLFTGPVINVLVSLI